MQGAGYEEEEGGGRCLVSGRPPPLPASPGPGALAGATREPGRLRHPPAASMPLRSATPTSAAASAGASFTPSPTCASQGEGRARRSGPAARVRAPNRCLLADHPLG
jgi:hypothetical protein